ncbi:unnamed protein product [Amoebophrya sp. A120]|nr:unnamed protein product [Amoebophrya sp. A120]|eukprot:GSA120T00022253001.1
MATPTSAAKGDERHDRRGPSTTQSTKSRLCAGCKYEVFPEKQPFTQEEFEQIPFFSGAVDGYTNRYYCADCLHKSESTGATVSSSGGKNKEKKPSIPREHVFYPTISTPGYLASIIKQIGKPTYYAAENIESDVPYLIPAKSNRLRRLERRSRVDFYEKIEHEFGTFLQMVTSAKKGRGTGATFYHDEEDNNRDDAGRGRTNDEIQREQNSRTSAAGASEELQHASLLTIDRELLDKDLKNSGSDSEDSQDHRGHYAGRTFRARSRSRSRSAGRGGSSFSSGVAAPGGGVHPRSKLRMDQYDGAAGGSSGTPSHMQVPAYTQQNDFSNIKCHHCGEYGHYVRQCPMGPRCHRCGEKGHFAKECPNLATPWGSSSTDPARKQLGTDINNNSTSTGGSSTTSLATANKLTDLDLDKFRQNRASQHNRLVKIRDAERGLHSDMRACNLCGQLGHIARDCNARWIIGGGGGDTGGGLAPPAGGPGEGGL